MSYGNMEKIKHEISHSRCHIAFCLWQLRKLKSQLIGLFIAKYCRNYIAVQCYMHMFVRKWKCPYGHVCTFMHSNFFNLGALQMNGFQFPQLLALAMLTRRG